MKVEDSDTGQGANDVLDEVNVVPANRLDADQYSAEDLDGVTEGVFGSGSVSYASLQAAQTDALIAEGGEASSVSLDLPSSLNTSTDQPREAAFNSDRPLSEADSYPLGDVQGEAAFTGNTVGSLAASTLSSDVGSFSETSGLKLSIGGSGSINSSASSSSNASTVNNADNSENTTNIDNREINNVEINNYNGGQGEIGLDLDLGILDTVMSNLTLGLDDSLEGALNVGAVTENLTDIVEVLTGISIPVFASPTVNVLFDLFNSEDAGDANDINIAGLEELDIRLDALENIVGDLDISVDSLNGFSVPTIDDLTSVNVFDLAQSVELATPSEVLETLGAQDIVGTLDVVLNQVHITQDISTDVQTLLDDVGVDLSPAQDLLSSVDTIVEDVNEVLDEVADAIAGLGDGLLPLGGGDADDGEDSDVVADLGLGVLDQSIADTVIDDPIEPVTDVVEDLVGDIDLGLGVATDLLGGDTGEGDEDTDLTINTDIDIVDAEIAEITDSVNLDAVEAITGDIDLDIDLAADVLGDAADGLIDDGAGGSGEDTLVAEVGDVLSDVGEQVVDVVTDVVGEPDVQIDAVSDVLGADGGGLLSLGGEDNDGDDSDVVADLGLGVLDQSIADTVIDDPIEPLTDIVEDLVGDVDLGLGVATDLLGGDTGEGDEDTDLEINTDIDLVDNEIVEVVGDVALDPVEEVVGDIDLDVDLAADVLGDVADGLIDDGAGGSGEDTLVAEVGDVLSDVGEQVVDVVTDVVGEPDVQIDVVVDPIADGVDALLESVDIDIGSSLDILNDDVFDTNDAAADDDLSWTESTISDGGGLFDDIISGLGGDGDVLPDPAGTVAEGLGVLDIEPELDIGSLGGLF